MTNQQILDRAFEELEREFHEAGIPINEITSVRINNRLSKALGYCKAMTWGGVVLKRPCSIEINPDVFVDGHPEILRDILAHEMCHAIPGTKGHTGKFEEWAKVINEKLGTNVTAHFQSSKYGLTEPLGAERRKYVIVCKKCGQKIYRSRACRITEHPENFYCGHCHGEFEVKKMF